MLVAVHIISIEIYITIKFVLNNKGCFVNGSRKVINGRNEFA